MLNIVWTRIDDRLIHGQVVTAWSKITKADRIVVVDDGVANDEFMVHILKMAAPSNFKIDIKNVKDASELLKEEDSGEKIMILVKSPETIWNLIEKGVEIKKVNLGGMGAKLGRKQLYRNISISDAERDYFRKMLDVGIDVSVQIVPDASAMNMRDLL